MLKRLSHSLMFIALAFHGQAQELLSLEEAIQKGLQKNYGVQIAKNRQEISKTQNNYGNAGMSPAVSLNANLGYANVNSHQVFTNGTVQDRNGAVSNNLGTSATISWLVFDGLRMFAVKKRLEINEEISAIELRRSLEQTVYNIILAYYDVTRINRLIRAQQLNIELYSERKKLAKARLEIGTESKVDLLLTQSDENRAKSDMLQLELQLAAAKTALNNLLVRPADTDFKTADSIAVSYDPTLEELKKAVTQKNSDYLITKTSERIFEQEIKEARSANLPFIQLNGAYNFTNFQSQAGFVLLNQQAGLSAGLSAGWLLFNGGRNRKLIKERQIHLFNQQLLAEQTKLELDAMVFLAYQSFMTQKKILELELQNLRDSREVMDISVQRYEIGKGNYLETKETQQNFEAAQVRYINALYNLKKAETELLRTNGSLVK